MRRGPRLVRWKRKECDGDGAYNCKGDRNGERAWDEEGVERERGKERVWKGICPRAHAPGELQEESAGGSAGTNTGLVYSRVAYSEAA